MSPPPQSDSAANGRATPRHAGERALVRRFRDLLGPGLAGAGVPFGDDMAPLTIGGPGGLWTVDMLMDGVDFDSREHAWHAIGRKALAVNLSDCAAMGVRPTSAIVAVALQDTLDDDAATELLRGLHDCGAEFGCPIVGGDTNSWAAPTVISVSVSALEQSATPPVRRDGARPGDGIYVTGPLGGSILGRHLTFTPRVTLGQAIRERLGPHAMMDISDGLALDLGRLCEASGCGAELDEADLRAVIHPDAERLSQQDTRPALDHALHDGEDFELIVVLAPDLPPDQIEELGLRRIGTADGISGLRLRSADGGISDIPERGWEHFQ
jgi:thiamine-monophosphate kinase